MIGKGKGERKDARRQLTKLKELYPWKHNVTGKCSHNPPMLPCLMQPISWRRMFLQTIKKRTRLWNKFDTVKNQSFTSLLPCLWGNPQPLPVSLRPHHLPQASRKRQAQHSPLLPLSGADYGVQLGAEAQQKRNSEGRKLVLLLSQEKSHNPDPQIARSAGFVIQIRNSLAFFLTKQVPLVNFSAEQVNGKCVTRRPAWGNRVGTVYSYFLPDDTLI